MGKRSETHLRALWPAKVIYGVSCVAILVTIYYRSDPFAEVREFGWTAPMWGMVLLSSPCGFVVALVARAILYAIIMAFDPPASPAYVWGGVFIQWAALFIGGYVQWFWLVPRVIRRQG